MDEHREEDDSKTFGKPQVLTYTNGFPAEPWHSTPVKKCPNEASVARQTSRSLKTPPNLVPSPSPLQGSVTPACDVEVSIIQRQRTELQLLIAELKERDRELNTMAAAHHRQLQIWQSDRQRVLSLEQKCARLEDELRKRNEVIRAVSKRLKAAETREKESQRELDGVKQQLQELSQKEQHSERQNQELEEKNHSLNSSVLTLSSQLGQLQVHVEELSSMLKLKDKDLMEATNHILTLSAQLRESEASLKDWKSDESRALREVEECRRRYREERRANARMKDELQEKTLENSQQREELIRLKQENQLLRKELAIAGEGESWKDEFIELARSRQGRTDSELHCLRQVCEKQQNDLQLLKLNLESSREALRQYEGQMSLESLGDVSRLSLDDSALSPQRGGSNPLLEDAVFKCALDGNTEMYVSSTSRLQRLLEESKQMVASLERSSGASPSPAHTPSPAPSPASRSGSASSLHSAHNNSKKITSASRPEVGCGGVKKS